MPHRSRTPRQDKDQISIEQRPAIVEKRIHTGNQEIDIVIGTPGKAVLMTMAKRKSRYTWIAKAKSQSARHASRAVKKAFSPHKGKRFTSTFDNGKEFALHKTTETLPLSRFYDAIILKRKTTAQLLHALL